MFTSFTKIFSIINIKCGEKIKRPPNTWRPFLIKTYLLRRVQQVKFDNGIADIHR